MLSGVFDPDEERYVYMRLSVRVCVYINVYVCTRRGAVCLYAPVCVCACRYGYNAGRSDEMGQGITLNHTITRHKFIPPQKNRDLGLMLMGQNHHNIHHLYPQIPFYRCVSMHVHVHAGTAGTSPSCASW